MAATAHDVTPRTCPNSTTDDERKEKAMSEKTVHHKSEDMMTRKQLADFLRDMADRIESNGLRFAQDGGEVRLDLAEQLEVEVKYQTKPKDGGTEYQLELEIEWGPQSEGVKLA